MALYFDNDDSRMPAGRHRGARRELAPLRHKFMGCAKSRCEVWQGRDRAA